jgi:uncharacterized protein
MTDTTVLAPVAAHERIEAMDVLRGFALLGILLMNIEAFVGPVYGALSGLDPALRGADRFADAAIYILVQGKFYTLFSLLFGMGFAVMLARAQAAGRPFAALYLRRTLALLAIGLAHLLLVWSGDILTVYALVALVLLALFRNTPVSRLPKWGLAAYLVPSLVLLLAGVAGSAAQADPAAAAELAEGLAAQQQAMDEAIAAQRAIQGGSDYPASIARRWADFGLFLGYLPVFGSQVLGMFLLGAWFVRSGAIARPGEFPRLYARLRWVALPAGLALMLLSYRLVPTVSFARMDLVSAAAAALAAVAGLLMCLGYLAWVLRGLQAGGAAARALAALAPAGRMALSNYLLQSLVCTAIFAGYGLGYFERLPRAWQVPFAFALFAAQVAASRWWLARYRFGPAEWLWRTATYGRRQPMRQPALA